MAAKIPKKDIPNVKNTATSAKSAIEDQENLGLDADHSSDPSYHHLNNDNDMISGNPDGESDDHDQNDLSETSPLLDK